MIDRGGSRNRVDGAVGPVVQAQHISGGVHFHTTEAAQRIPQQVPAAKKLVNQVRLLALADGAAGVIEAGGPHVIVLHGIVGSGRRAVIRKWVHKEEERFPDGFFYADLSERTEQPGLESDCLREFLLAVGYPPPSIPDTEAGRAACFRSWSAGKRIVVVLDNVLTGRQVEKLKPGPGPSLVLVSSEGSLAGLGPRSEATQIEVPLLDAAASWLLLADWIGEERLRAEPEAAAALVGFCDGLPLALCLLGAMLQNSQYRPLRDQADELADERGRLEAISVTPDVSLQAMFNRAYDRLSPPARRCYHLFGVHPGTGSVALPLLTEVLDLPPIGARRAMGELLKASLVREVSHDRYAMTDLIRIHARNRAGQEGSAGDRMPELDAVLDFYRHRALVAGLAVMPDRGWDSLLFQRRPESRSEPAALLGEEPWDWLEAERTTLRACVDAGYERERLELVCDLCLATWPLHLQGRHLEDLVHVNGRGVQAAQALRRPDLGALLGIQQGFGYLNLGLAERAVTSFTAALGDTATTGTALVDAGLRATALESLGLARLQQGRDGEARPLLRENLDLALRLRHPRRTSLARLHLGRAEEPETGVPLLRQALAGFTSDEVADPYNEAKARLWLGRRLGQRGESEEATSQLQSALAEMTTLARPFDCLMILESMGDLASSGGSPAEAAAHYQDALLLGRQYGYESDVARLKGKVEAVDGSLLVDGDLPADPGEQH